MRNPFDGMSVRWAILKYYNEFATDADGRGTTEIAEALTSGGVRSGSQNFVANVSAVVSVMKGREELEFVDGKYRLTTRGRETWQTIKTSRKYRTLRQF